MAAKIQLTLEETLSDINKVRNNAINKIESGFHRDVYRDVENVGRKWIGESGKAFVDGYEELKKKINTVINDHFDFYCDQAISAATALDEADKNLARQQSY